MIDETEDRAKQRYLELEKELDEKTRDFEDTTGSVCVIYQFVGPSLESCNIIVNR